MRLGRRGDFCMGFEVEAERESQNNRIAGRRPFSGYEICRFGKRKRSILILISFSLPPNSSSSGLLEMRSRHSQHQRFERNFPKLTYFHAHFDFLLLPRKS